MERRLAAILAADVAGYSRLMEQDESGTLAALKALQSAVIEPVSPAWWQVSEVDGRWRLVELPSIVEAVQSAVDIQREITTRN